MQDEVKVTQADERAVAEFHRQSFETLFATTDADIDAGINRAHTLLCQAFARHRHQAERETLARMEPVAWLERHGYGDGEVETHIHLADSSVGQHIAKYQTHEHGKTLFPLYALPPAPEAGQ